MTARVGERVVADDRRLLQPPVDAPVDARQGAGDLVDPLWGLLDMTPEGRGDFFPKVNYG